MKRFITVLSSLLVLPAFAEVAPVYYDDIIEYSDDVIDDEETPVVEEKTTVSATKNVAQRQTINRSTSATRAISSANNNVSQRSNASSRAVAASSRTTTPRSSTVSARGTSAKKPVTARVGTSNNSVMPGTRVTARGSQQTLENTSGSLYNARTERVGVANRRSTARVSTAAVTATTPTITEEDVKTTTDNLTALAELTDYCKAQYAACMDNYCNVLDDNQGRCSCSKNIKNYEKTEAALSKVTEEFQNVVQKIKYIGLTGPQIEALFAETEAELKMKNASDSSSLQNSLSSIKKSIVDITSPSSSSFEASSGISLDLNGLLSADFTSGFDLSSFLGTNSTTTTVSNQRGEQLYKTATNRCKTAVLNSCTAQGINANVITNSYDLEIDKQCIAYERNLNEANKEMRNNVINASSILQQARLLLAQNRNSYDLRGCVAAIDACMQDEYVCGSDYELCLDPTGKYLANGEILKGGTPGVAGGQNKTTKQICSDECSVCTGTSAPQYPCDYPEICPSGCQTMNAWTSGGMYNLYSVWNYDTAKNAWGVGTSENLGGYIDEALTSWKTAYKQSKDTTKTDNMATYLLQKIGYVDDSDTVHGMCASVMKQCQDYTFDGKGNSKKYIPSNEVVRQYLNTTLAKIKAKQDAVISDYAEDCRSDVQSCLTSNGYDTSNSSSTASKTAVNACAQEITTCMSVGGYQIKEGTKLTLKAMSDWVGQLTVSCDTNEYAEYNESTGATKCSACPVAYLLTAENTTEYTWETLHNANSSSVEGTGPSQAGFAGPKVNNTTMYGYFLLNQNETNKKYMLLKGAVSIADVWAKPSQMTSAGGQADSCSCPDGYNYKHIEFTCPGTSTGTNNPCTATGKVVHYCVQLNQ